MDTDQVNKMFEKFYKESPAALIPLASYTPEHMKLAMEGAYKGGFIAAMEFTNGKLDALLKKHGH